VGGKQYKVSAGDTVVLNRLSAEVGRQIEVKKVLMVGGREWTMIGTPLVECVPPLPPSPLLRLCRCVWTPLLQPGAETPPPPPHTHTLTTIPFHTGRDASVSVRAVVTSHFRGAKVQVFKKKRRKNYAKRMGHRQEFTNLRILQIDAIAPTSA
jgi:large subunit ribosomal protein L21